MIIFPESWTLLDKINHLQRKIILNSIMYYMYDKSFISDHFYDSCCKQLVKLQEEYGPGFVDDSMYGYAYYDFDGSTGYHLYGRLTKDDKQNIMEISLIKLNRTEEYRV